MDKCLVDAIDRAKQAWERVQRDHAEALEIENESRRTPYAVICYGDSSIGHHGCGRVYLTKEQYMQQMGRPDATWKCPQCGFEAGFDDANYEEWLSDMETPMGWDDGIEIFSEEE